MNLPMSVIQFSEGFGSSELVAAVQRIEALGYAELWLPELFGREPIASCGYLLALTKRLRISTGIANVYARDADAAAQAANTLAELSGGRFTLGLGVSHPILVEPRGHQWVLPVPKMRAYLTRMREAPILGRKADVPASVVVAGHGPGLMKVVAEQADGLFILMQAPATVRLARTIIGPKKAIHVAVRCILDSDPDRARDLARRACAFYIARPPYHKAWAAVGFNESDWSNGGSDRLIDTICVWGDAAMIKTKLQRFVDAGASHIVLYPCNPDENYSPDQAMSLHWNWPLYEALAPG